jgi:2-polyprenyl-6-methoxyphenol hydroxylase-like FAD-dependent oxidoreductase
MSGFDADIIVVGAGPVGMCAAIEAGRRGKSVIVLERREAEDPAGAKCNTVAARTMETFRSLWASPKKWRRPDCRMIFQPM